MPDPFILTSEQRDRFIADGVVRLPAVIPREVTDAMADRIWRALERKLGGVRGQPETWTAQGGPAIVPGLGQMGHAGVFAGMLSPEVRSILSSYFGNRRWREPALLPTPLGPIFPTRGRPWNVPTLHWHLDRDPGLPADMVDTPWPGCLRVFAYLSDVESGGGGTCYVAGSHRAATLIATEMRARRERVRSAEIIERLKRQSPWLADLCSRGKEDDARVTRFMHEGAMFRDIPLRVAEMTAGAGDLILWHPNLLHTYSPHNARDTPRLVLSVTILGNA